MFEQFTMQQRQVIFDALSYWAEISRDNNCEKDAQIAENLIDSIPFPIFLGSN